MDDILLIFLGYLASMGVIGLGLDQEKGTYIEQNTGKTVGEIVREFSRDMKGEGQQGG